MSRPPAATDAPAELALGGRGASWREECRRVAPRRHTDRLAATAAEPDSAHRDGRRPDWPADRQPALERPLGVERAADLPRAAPATTAELARALADVADPVYLVDRQWRVRWTNARAAEVWGGPPERFVGRSLWEVHPRAVRTHAYEHLVEAMRERRSTIFEAFSAALATWVEICAYPTGDGLLVYYRATDRLRGDLTTQHALAAERAARIDAERLAEELRAASAAAADARSVAQRAQARAELAARAKSDFLATMSHELRTPINAVTGYAELLELGVAGPVTAAQREYLARLHASGRHLLGLVDDILDLTRLDTGRLSVACEPARTGTAVASALAVVAADAAARAIRLTVEPADVVEGAPYHGDEHRVRQVLVNLLANAVKFTPAGGCITVRTGRSTDARTGAPPGGPWSWIEVADTGPGVPPELREAIFEPFVQGDGSRTRAVGGTGLGLSISRRLARLMGGDLTLAPSAPPTDADSATGATFTLWLPSEPPAHLPCGGDDVPEPAQRAASVATAEPLAPAADGGVLPTAGAPSALPHPDRGLGAVAHHLRARLEPILEAYVARLRTDATIPHAADSSRPQLEDHALSFLADLAQSLVVIHETGGLDGGLLRDGSAIQEHIAFRHGEQRHRLGWQEEHVRRDYAVLQDELDAVVRQLGATVGGIDVPYARSILHRLLARARDVSVRGWRHAAR